MSASDPKQTLPDHDARANKIGAVRRELYLIACVKAWLRGPPILGVTAAANFNWIDP